MGFVSALDNEPLDATIRHREPGVKVTGAGHATANGLYRRRATSAGPPSGYPPASWSRHVTPNSCYYYVKDEDHYIYWCCKKWLLCHGTRVLYSVPSESSLLSHW